MTSNSPKAWPSETSAWLEEMLRQLPPATSWKAPDQDCPGFYSAAEEALGLRNGRSLLPAGQALSFDQTLSIRHVAGGSGEMDSVYHSLLFKGVAFDALVWMQRDPDCKIVVWRGDLAAFNKAEMMLRMFDGQTLAHLR